MSHQIRYHRSRCGNRLKFDRLGQCHWLRLLWSCRRPDRIRLNGSGAVGGTSNQSGQLVESRGEALILQIQFRLWQGRDRAIQQRDAN
jgi:hypothetical protein